MHADKKRFFPTGVFPRGNSSVETLAFRCAKSTSLLFKGGCVVCNASLRGVVGKSSVFCEHCNNSIVKELPCASELCRNCGVVMRGESVYQTCQSCLAEPPPYRALHTIGNYEGALADLVVRAKIARQVVAIAALNELILRHSVDLSSLYSGYSLLPMPTPRWRLMQRGFNLPRIFACTLAKKYCLPIVPATSATLPFYVAKQAKLNRLERQRNKHSFCICRALPKRVIIVDDIVTTGSTVRELARAVRYHGAESVVVWACLRAQVSGKRGEQR